MRSLFKCFGFWVAATFVVNLHASEVNYHIDIRQTQVNFSGKVTSAITLNGGIPAPTLEASVGDIFRVTFVNYMDVETSIHWHGVLLPNDQDGVPYLTTQPILPNSEFTFEFPITHHGTYWYHSHTGLQEQRGIYGALVFHPEQERFTADREQVLVFSDWTDEDPYAVLRNLKRDDDYYTLKKDKVQSWDQVIAHGSKAIKNRLNANWMRMGPMDLSDVGYDAFLVNGKSEKSYPDLLPGQKLRLRLVNASASTYKNIRFAGGPIEIVAADGVDVQPLMVNELTMAVAETYDILVSVPDTGAYELRASANDGTGYSSTWIGAGNQRHRVENYQPPNPYLVDHSEHAMDEAHSDNQHENSHHAHHGMHAGQSSTQDQLGHYLNLRALEPIKQGDKRPVREILLRLTGSMDGYRWSFNNQPLSVEDRILISHGERIRFVLKNETMMNHPMHLHGHFFRVITDEGDFSPIKHTVNVPSMETVVIEFDADEEKDWFFHCHNLYHMKAGMSRVVRYDDFQGDPNLPSTLGPVRSEDNRYWSFADLGLLSSKAELSAWRFNNRHQWSLDAEYDWDALYELEVDYAYRVDRFTLLYAGVDAEKHQGEAETLGVLGIRYLLPGMIESELRMDDEGDLRLELGAELRLSKHTEIEWYWNTGQEYGLEFIYEPNKELTFVVSHEQDFGTGLGVELRF